MLLMFELLFPQFSLRHLFPQNSNFCLPFSQNHINLPLTLAPLKQIVEFFLLAMMCKEPEMVDHFTSGRLQCASNATSRDSYNVQPKSQMGSYPILTFSLFKFILHYWLCLQLCCKMFPPIVSILLSDCLSRIP